MANLIPMDLSLIIEEQSAGSCPVLRVLPADDMKLYLIENGPIANTQKNLFNTE